MKQVTDVYKLQPAPTVFLAIIIFFITCCARGPFFQQLAGRELLYFLCVWALLRRNPILKNAPAPVFVGGATAVYWLGGWLAVGLASALPIAVSPLFVAPATVLTAGVLTGYVKRPSNARLAIIAPVCFILIQALANVAHESAMELFIQYRQTGMVDPRKFGMFNEASVADTFATVIAFTGLALLTEINAKKITAANQNENENTPEKDAA